MEKYVVGGVIGEGQFGSVKEAKLKSSGAPVALKLIRVNRLSEGIPHPVAREAIITTRLTSCPFVVRTYEVFPYGSHLVLAMERCQTDLAAVLRAHTVYNPLPAEQAKTFLKMLLSALQYLHSLGILHRDVKPSNCLVSSKEPGGLLKLGDFGLSRIKGDPGADMSHEVASRWYRAPELLFGKRQYGGEIDMWSAGCIFGELLRGFGSPLFTGDGDISQLSRIFSVLGTPDEASWPGMCDLPDYDKVRFTTDLVEGLERLVPRAKGQGIDLLSKLLALDPAKRLTAQEALRHPYFYTT